MRDESKKELDGLMDRWKDDQDGLRAHRAQEKVTEDQFMVKFEALKHDVIWPAIVEIGNQLTTYGHDYHVGEEPELVDATAHFTPASLIFNIYPSILDKSVYTPEATPYISFVADKYAKKVGVMVSTMMPGRAGVVGAHGSFTLEEITPELVEKEIITVLKNSLIFQAEK